MGRVGIGAGTNLFAVAADRIPDLVSQFCVALQEFGIEMLVEPEHMRQLFNDTGSDSLWLVVGAPREDVSSTLEMTEEQLEAMYPDGPKALPPELGGGTFEG